MLNPFNSEPLLSISDIIALGGFIVASLSFLLAFLSFKQSKKAAEPQVIIYTDHFYTETADGESLYLKNYIIIQNYGSVSATITNVTYANANLVNEHLPILTNLKGITLAPNQSIKSEFFYKRIDLPIHGTVEYSWEKQRKTYSSQFIIDTKIAKSIKASTRRITKGKKVSYPVINRTTE